MKSAPRSRVVRFGSREVISKGLPYRFWSDLSHRSMTAPWPLFIAATTGMFLAVNCLFAAIYMLGDAPIANSNGTFLQNLYFSIETYTTVGYGDMHPQTHFGHLVASVELFVGVFTTALITGLVFFRFSRARARVLFADVAPVATHDGKPSLMIRLANERMNAISVAEARLWILRTYMTAEGRSFRRFDELPLLRRQSPLFTLSWTIIHPIDETSPLHKADDATLVEQDIAIMVIIEGHDETTGQTVRARKTYYAEDIRFGHRYVDMLDLDQDQRTTLNYARFHLSHPE